MSGTSGSGRSDGADRPDRALRLVEAVSAFFEGFRFPALALSLLAFFELLLVALLLIPAAPSGLGAFAEDFRVWCFGYDPATRRLEWGYVAMVLVQFAMLAGLVGFLWRRPLAAVLREAPRRVLPYALAGLAAVGATAAGFGLMGAASASGELPFPAERLRMAKAVPGFRLVDQDGREVSPEGLAGRVVLITGVYSRCGYTCPMIMAQSKRAVAALTDEEKRGLAIVAITLDPQNDTREVLAKMAEAQGVAAPLYHLVTGDPAAVERALDALEIARTRDPATGVIDHANLFLLVDRHGRLAYRLGLGQRQEQWLTTALRLLVRE